MCFDMQELARKASSSDQANCLTYLKHWLTTLSLHAPGAPVLIVGTHKDKVSGRKDHEIISSRLCEALAGSGLFTVGVENDGLWFFPVDNTKSAADEGVQKLRGAIEATAKAQTYVRLQTPVRWLAYVEFLRRGVPATATSKAVAPRRRISLDAFCETAARFNITRDEAETQLLPVLHEFGLLFHFEQPELRDLVVLEPQWLVETFTAIIRDYSLHVQKRDKNAAAHGTEWKMLTKHAQLSSKLLPFLWPEHTEAERAACLELMWRYQLAVPLSSKAAGAGAAASGGKSGAAPSSDASSLVPSLLPLDLSGEARVMGVLTDVMSDKLQARMPRYEGYPRHADQAVCYMAFHLADLVESSACSVDELVNACCLPSGLYAHLLCHLVREHQFGGGDGSALNEQMLSRSVSVLQFGLVKVEIACVPHIGSLRITVHADEGIRLVRRVEAAVKAVLEASFPMLRHTIFLPYNKTTMIRLDWLQTQLLDKKAVAVKGVPVDAQAMYVGFVPQRGLLSRYHAFISYRQVFNSKFAERLYERLELTFLSGKQPLHVFWDRVGLEAGRRFDRDFCTALSHSSVALPLISAQALERMRDLGQQDEVDHVLLEWILMLALVESGRLARIYPLVLGDGWSNIDGEEAKDISSFKTLFQFVENELPDVISHKSYDDLDDFLESELKLPKAKRHTVRQVVTTLLRFDALNCINTRRDNFGVFQSYAESVRKVVEGVGVVSSGVK